MLHQNQHQHRLPFVVLDTQIQGMAHVFHATPIALLAHLVMHALSVMPAFGLTVEVAPHALPIALLALLVMHALSVMLGTQLTPKEGAIGMAHA
jgi:hypothetical protein